MKEEKKYNQTMEKAHGDKFDQMFILALNNSVCFATVAIVEKSKIFLFDAYI